MALKKICDPTRDKVTSEWIRIHNEDNHNLYSSPNTTRVVKLRRIRWARHVARMRGERTDAYLIFVRKTEARLPYRRHRRRWENNIKIDLDEWYGPEWTGFIWIIGRGGEPL